MQQSDLQPAGALSVRNGVKILTYGPPGSGKTPVFNTAPQPVLMSCEPGLLSMQGSTVPTWKAENVKRIDEFFTWLKGSRERFNFHCVGIDSVSEMCDIYIRENPKKISHGMQLYGAMAEWAYEKLFWLYNSAQMHTYLICKQMVETTDGGKKLIPYFPGNALNASVPYLYDEILHLDKHIVPQIGQVSSFWCHSGFGVSCRDRSGKLGEYEPPDLSAIIAKCQT